VLKIEEDALKNEAGLKALATKPVVKGEPKYRVLYAANMKNGGRVARRKGMQW
jgi:hypothetical protein